MDNPNIDTKAIFAPKKGKQPTKGQKEIHEGNLSTIKTCMIIAIASVAIKLYYYSGILSFLFPTTVQSLSMFGMNYIVKSDGAIDLNLSGGFGDKIYDIIVTTTVCSFLSIFSELFWVLWLWLPAYYLVQLWINVLGPWFFAPAPESEVPEKKRKKMERKMARSGYRSVK